MRIVRKEKLYQITFMPNFFPVNCYLVEEESELTLIDAALPYSAKGILRAAEKLQKPITRIVLTHAHDDHVGALDSLKNALPDAKVLISSRDARLLTGDRGLEPSEPQTPIRGGVPSSVRTKPDILLQDGDRVGSLVAVAAPGHTPGLFAFYDERNGSLIAGDAFQTHGGIAVSGQMKLFFPFPAWATWNKQQALDSARRLLGLKPALLAVGHGSMVDQPLSAMERAIREAEKSWGG